MRSETVGARRRLVAEGAAILEAAGLPTARREALRLWTEITGESPADALIDEATSLAADRVHAFTAAVRKRAAGEPLAYVTGQTGFRHLTVRTDRRALIPRPETEGLIDLVLARVPGGRVADVGTGTGCIALSLAHEGHYDEIVATDRSAAALELASENRRLTGGRIHLVRGDLCDPLRPASLDALVSNPPYLTDDEHAALDPSVREWEPAEALASGTDGLDAIGRLLEAGRGVVRRGGWLALEVDSARAACCARRAGASGWTDVAVHADLFGRERFLLARRSDAP